MGFLKSLVIILAILIVLAIGLLLYGLIKQAEDPNWHFFSEPLRAGATHRVPPSSLSSAGRTPATQPWGDINLNLPIDCQVSNFIVDSQRLYLIIGPIGLCHRIVIINSSTGRVLGSVKVNQ